MPVSNFSIAVLMGHVEDDPVKEVTAESRKESTESTSHAETEGEAKERSPEHTSVNNTSTNSSTNSSKKVKEKDANETSVTTMSTFQRKRTSFSRLQQRMLEAKFQRAPYLTIQERNNLANFLQLNTRQVKVWFQNRRNKWKRENKGQFLIQPAIEMKPCSSYNTGLENCFSYVMYNPPPCSQLYFTPGSERR